MPLAAISAAASLGGAALQANAAGQAGKAGQAAADATVRANQQSLNTIGNDVNPIIGYGNSAGNELAGLLGTGGNPAASRAAFDTFRNSTNYNFLLKQGEQAQGFLNAPNLDSGATGKALINYGQGMAGNALQGYEGLLQNQEGLGLQGSGIYANAATNFGNQNMQARFGGANAMGNAALAQGQAGANALNGIGNLFSSSYGQMGSLFGGGSNAFSGYGQAPGAGTPGVNGFTGQGYNILQPNTGPQAAAALGPF